MEPTSNSEHGPNGDHTMKNGPPVPEIGSMEFLLQRAARLEAIKDHAAAAAARFKELSPQDQDLKICLDEEAPISFVLRWLDLSDVPVKMSWLRDLLLDHLARPRTAGFANSN